jgi:energy-coupling factor transporter ATP-binding protein EcfA2
MSSSEIPLFLPDRFDMLQRRASSQLDSIVVPVEAALSKIKRLHVDLGAAGRGAFLLLRGDSGSGKSTFLNTVGLFLSDVEVKSIPREESVETILRGEGETSEKLRLIIIEGRDALREVSASELESAIHEVNSFLRSKRGERTIVVWPVNTDDLEHAVIETCRRVGSDALLGVAEPSFRFSGPPKSQFLDIASRTLATLNQGASLADLGVSEVRAKELVENAPTIGHFLGLLRKDLLANQAGIEQLLDKERCRLWVVVVAGNDPEGDVGGLTRGASSAADIERLMGATNANIIQDFKKFPEKLGILGAVLDAKILHLPSVTALAISRDFADTKLTDLMVGKGLSVARKMDAGSRLLQSDLARALSSSPMGTRTRGPKPGSNTVEAFRKLTEIAAKADQPLNAALGRALQNLALIDKFETERDLGQGLTRYTDVVCSSSTLGIVRIEVMWRASCGRADIANYALTKLYNYGSAIGVLN